MKEKKNCRVKRVNFINRYQSYYIYKKKKETVENKINETRYYLQQIVRASE